MENNSRVGRPLSLPLRQPRRMHDAIWGTSNIQHRISDVEGASAVLGTPEENCAAIGTESRNAAVADRRYIETFDAVKASQARSALIQATIIFFALDSECPSPSGNLSA